VNRTHSGLYDVNGDGLPDEVAKDAGEPFFRVRANLGDRFSDEEIRLWRPDWSEDPSAYLSGGLESDLGALYASMDADVPGACLRPPETLPDGSGNRFSELFDPFRIEDVLEYETGVSYSFGAGVSVFVPLALLAVTIVPGINMSVAKTSATLKFMDIDGDRLPDHVLQLPGQDRVLVRRNISGKAGLLKSASLPEGGSYRFEYESVGNTPQMPQRRWVMSALIRSAGSLPSDRGKTEYGQTYAYEGGYYDRAERMFFGFSRVTAARADGSTITAEYHNRDLWLRGMIRRSAVADSRGTLLAEAITETGKACVEGSGRKAVCFPAVAAQEWRVYDPDDASYSARRMEYEYDIDTGNVIRARDLGDPALAGDDLSASIRYASLGYRFREHPESMEVTDASGAVLRRRAADYGGRGEPVALDEYYEEGRYSRRALSWDGWGNLAGVTDPRGSRVSWKYDDEVHAHAVAIVRDNAQAASDSYVTRAEWDYRLGRALSRTDANGRTMSLSYDAFGRLLSVRSPYDDPGGMPALRFEYRMGAFPGTAVAYSKISHDPDDEQVLRTVSTVDGLGRKLQTAKEGERRGASGERIHGWNVSGAVAYDGVGRTEAEGQPMFIEADGPPCLGGMERPTSYGYDGLDRTVLTVLPDGATIKVEYGIASGCPVATTIDPLGNWTEERSDARGNTLTVTRKDQSGTVLTSASYGYDALGQMLRATDARGVAVTAAYDLAGRRVSLESADTGAVRWTYDESGNLVRKTDPVLRSRKEAVRYEYDGLNRLIRIDYPRSADAIFEYGAADTGNGAGRLVRRTDQSGTSSWAYGELGEVIAMTRSIDRLTPLADPEQAAFSYEWDYLGRLQRVVYPDGEIVAYGYDAGGRIRTVTGRYGGLATEYVKDIAYDARGRRSRIEYGNGTATSYAYDEDRQWLVSIQTAFSTKTLQDMEYSFDAVGNVLGCVNGADAYETSQSYAYDSLYRLVRARGTTTSKPYGVPDRTGEYLQTFAYDEVGNLTRKTSRSSESPGGGLGDDLDYSLAYTYREGKAHQPEIIGNNYLAYDANGNLIEAREGGHGTGAAPGGELYRDGEVRYTDYGFGLARKGQAADGTWARYYVWDEENRLLKSVEGDLTARYRYGADGQRAVKCSGGSETLYFDPMWQASTDYPGFRKSKHVYVGRTRVATRLSLSDSGAAYAQINTYYYHPDHLGSAQLVTDYHGAEYERIEYTPHGELWVEKTSESLDKIPFRFTGKELDEETGLYYCGARYLDPKTGMWISADPALGEYLPRSPESGEARERNRNLPGMGGVYNPANLHLYHYALNNPVRYTDPDGRRPEQDVDRGIIYYEDYGRYEGRSYIRIDRTYGHSEGHFQSTLSVVLKSDDGDEYVVFRNNVQSYADRRKGSCNGKDYTMGAGEYLGKIVIDAKFGSYKDYLQILNADGTQYGDGMFEVHPNQKRDGSEWTKRGLSDGCQVMYGGIKQFDDFISALGSVGRGNGTAISIKILDPVGIRTTCYGYEERALWYGL
jgi:RHS repeat-associated protein